MSVLPNLRRFGAQDFVPTLWVDSALGDDTRSKATVAASGGLLPWASPWRASWGSTDRSNPVPSEAADAVDVVNVKGGTYLNTTSVGSVQSPLLNSANNGQPNRYITYVADGIVRLANPAANSPAIGAYQRSYIRYYGNLRQGKYWYIVCDARGASDDTKGDNTIFNTKAGSGPVVGWESTGLIIDGIVLDGGPQTDWTDNLDGVRLEGATGTILRNMVIRNFNNLNNTVNGACVKIYYSPNTLLELSTFLASGAGVTFKDLPGTPAGGNSGSRVRQCKFGAGLIHGVAFSQNGNALMGRNYIYQNFFKGILNECIHITGGGLDGDWFFNNAFYDILSQSESCVLASSNWGSGGRFWNNAVKNVSRVYSVSVAMPAAATFNGEHNVYDGIGNNFYAGPDGTRATLANFKSAYSDQEQSTANGPASISQDPLFQDPANEDFRLQPASPARNQGVDIGDLDADGLTTDLVHAGPHLTNAEQLGAPMAA